MFHLDGCGTAARSGTSEQRGTGKAKLSVTAHRFHTHAHACTPQEFDAAGAAFRLLDPDDTGEVDLDRLMSLMQFLPGVDVVRARCGIAPRRGCCLIWGAPSSGGCISSRDCHWQRLESGARVAV